MALYHSSIVCTKLSFVKKIVDIKKGKKQHQEILWIFFFKN